MSANFDSAPLTRSELMRRVTSRGTQPELLLRRALRDRGLKFQACPKNVLGKPDIVFRPEKVAVFVDGEFWHGIQWETRGLFKLDEQFSQTASKNYWIKKIRRNQTRDCIVTNSLLRDGWKVIRFWEQDIRKHLSDCADLILSVLNKEPDFTSHSLLSSKTFLEFFAGIGLVRKSLERDSWKVVFSNDIDSQKFEMYKAQFPDADVHFVVGDIETIRPKRLPAAALATASFPCNDLSAAGSRRGLAGLHSSAFWGFVKILKSLGNRKPPLVLLENVTGFLTSSGGKDFEEALCALNSLGYGVDPFIIDAVRFVPQSRQRLFVVGVLGAFSTTTDATDAAVSDTRPEALVRFIKKHQMIRWNIRNLPSLPVRSIELAHILEELPDDAAEWWSPDRANYLLNQMSPKHRRIADWMIGQDEFSYGTVFRRVRTRKSMAELRTDGIAGCLRTPRGGSGRQILFKGGKGKFAVRLLTPRECARLMGVDDYHLDVPLNQALFGFGDGVCVPVIDWIVQNYFNPVITALLRGHCLYLPPSLR